MVPNTAYAVDVIASGGVWSDTLVSGPLPRDVAAIEIEGSSLLVDALVLFEVHDPDGFRGALVVNHQGKVVWYFRTVGALTGSTLRSNGNFVFVDLGEGLIEVTPDGYVVGRLTHPAERVIHHDVIETAGETVLFLTTDRRDWRGETVVGDAIWGWRPGAEARLLWSALDHLSPDEDWAPRSRNSDWLHANSLSLGPRGNHVVSFNFLNQVISISSDFSEIEWRLGGPNATIKVDAEGLFSVQHTATELSTGNILMFDNGWERAEPFSRALELRVDGSRVVIHRDLRPSPMNWSRALSSAFRTAEGSTYITYGLPQGLAGSTGPIESFVVGAAGEDLGSYRFDGQIRSVYRGTPLATIGRERPVR